MQSGAGTIKATIYKKPSALVPLHVLKKQVSKAPYCIHIPVPVLNKISNAQLNINTFLCQ
jgi:lipid II:glycine glycyltransferase (peptidoglycan interpeptide bridge formation enzyme)